MATLQQISDFIAANINKPDGPQIISQAAIANGVTLEQILQATGATEQQAVDYFGGGNTTQTAQPEASAQS